MRPDGPLDRVRKLLALATSPNPHEAAVAAARAQALIDEHRLEEWLAAAATVADDPDPIVDARDAPLDVARRLRPWKIVLAAALADANGCVAYTLDRGADEAVVLVGRARDRDAIGALWAWLVPHIQWLSATHGAGRDRRWHDAFRIGVVEAIAARLGADAATRQAEIPAPALVVVGPAQAAHKEALDRFVREHLSLRKGRGLRLDPRARDKGAAATTDLAWPAADRADPASRRRSG